MNLKFKSWIMDEQMAEEERMLIESEGKKSKTRICMMCSDVFVSEGNHNRICTPCKHTDDWTYGNDYGILD
tara:strand:+ start:182 stop:394 length:213 start_codon:yes stop_codon:yes gene_type:complete